MFPMTRKGVQRFDASACVAEFGNVDPDGGMEDVAGFSKGGDQDGKVAVGAPQEEWIARLAVDLMYKLRGKVDPGSVSSVHIDATRRLRWPQNDSDRYKLWVMTASTG